MGKVSAFGFYGGNSILHRLDVRCKLICLSIMSIGLLNAGFAGLSLVSLIFSAIAASAGLSFKDTLMELKYFFILLLFVFIARVLNTTITTPETPVMSFMAIIVSKQGILDGIQVTWRFLLVMIMGLMFTFSTQPSSIKRGVEWLLKPVPFIPEKRAGMMVSLFIRFLPMIIGQAKDITLAQNARCADFHKNPFKRITMISVPLIRKIFQSADHLAMAMESRCYSEERTDLPLTLSGYEMRFYICTSLLFVFIINT